MSTESGHGVTPQDLYAYFDDELSDDRAQVVAQALAQDADLLREHEQLFGLRDTVRASLEAEAEAVPDARFEQVWDEIDRAIARDARLQAEADRGASIWTRIWAAFAPVRVPVFAAAAAAAVTVVIVSMGDDGASNNPPSVASVDEQPAETPVAPKTAPSEGGSEHTQPDRLVQATPTPAKPPESETEFTPMVVPESSEVEIHEIDFGGRQGSISNSGTVTVLFVDDEEPTNSERSL